MARTSKGPVYYKSKCAWYANIKGRRVLLARGPRKPTEEEAREKYDAEMAASRVEVAGDRNTVWAVLNAYLTHCQSLVKNRDMAENTYRIHSDRIVPFNERFGAVAVR